jgi:hypothetical protein
MSTTDFVNCSCESSNSFDDEPLPIWMYVLGPGTVCCDDLFAAAAEESVLTLESAPSSRPS